MLSLDDLQSYEQGGGSPYGVFVIFVGGDQLVCGMAEYHVCQCSYRNTFLDHA